MFKVLEFLYDKINVFQTFYSIFLQSFYLLKIEVKEKHFLHFSENSGVTSRGMLRTKLPSSCRSILHQTLVLIVDIFKNIWTSAESSFCNTSEAFDGIKGLVIELATSNRGFVIYVPLSV